MTRLAFLPVGLVDLAFEFLQTLAERTEQLFELRTVLLGEALRFVFEDGRREVFKFRFEGRT
jgi:hypothetical protein